MPLRRRLDPHALVAVLAALASIAVGALTLGDGDGTHSVSTGSVTAKAAVADDGRPSAERFPVDGPAMQGAVALAQGYWSTAPCNGSFSVTWEPMDRMTNATASWRNPTDAWNNPGENFDCEIRFNTEADYDWEKLCSVMVHEIGHLVGKDHSSDPRDVMSPMYSDPLRDCVVTPEPGAPVAAQASDEAEAPVAAPSRSESSARKAAKRRAAKRRAAKRRAAKRRARAALRVKARSGRVRIGRRAFRASARYSD